MILHRFGAAVKRQDWVAVSIELGVLVVGILGALAVDAWWQEREEDRRVGEYVSQLAVDLADTEDAVAADLEANRTYAARIDSLARAFTAGAPPPDSTLRRLTRVGYAFSQPVRGTADALIATGACAWSGSPNCARPSHALWERAIATCAR